MERAASYEPWRERPRLTVVHDGGSESRFSMLPHAMIRDTRVSRDARLLVAAMQMYGWQTGECRASHATLAADLGCSTRMLRQYLSELIDAKIITEHDAGVRRQKVYRLVSIGTVLPIETPSSEKPASDYSSVNRKFSTRQSEVFDTSNRKPASDSKKKTPERKTPEEHKQRSKDRLPGSPQAQKRVIDLIVAGGADSPTFGGRDGKAIKESGEPETIAAAYLAIWRGE